MPQDIQAQLDALSDEEYAQLKQAVNKKLQGQPQQTPVGKFLTSAGRAIRAGGEGMLLASQGRPLSEGIYTNRQNQEPNKYEELLRNEQLKNQIDPSRIQSQMEVDEINRKKNQQNIGVNNTGIEIEPNKQSKIDDSNPPPLKTWGGDYDRYGAPVLIDNPDRKLWDKKREEMIKSDVKKEGARKEIDNYFAIDDLIQSSRGTGLDRIEKGLNLKVEGFKQETPVGRAQAQLSTARKNLRVTIARIKDVGNLSATEQQAADNLIPTDFDSQEVRNLKKAYLEDISSAADSGDLQSVKDVLNRWLSENNSSNNSIPSIGSDFNGEKVISIRKIE